MYVVTIEKIETEKKSAPEVKEQFKSITKTYMINDNKTCSKVICISFVTCVVSNTL